MATIVIDGWDGDFGQILVEPSGKLHVGLAKPPRPSRGVDLCAELTAAPPRKSARDATGGRDGPSDGPLCGDAAGGNAGKHNSMTRMELLDQALKDLCLGSDLLAHPGGKPTRTS